MAYVSILNFLSVSAKFAEFGARFQFAIATRASNFVNLPDVSC